MRPEDIPDDIWEAAEAAGEAMHGRHERGWVAWPLIPAHGTASNREIVARALLAERLKEREACAKLIEEGFDRPVGTPRVPGHRSKNDYCLHQRFMYEDCEQCAVAAIRSRP